MTQECTPLQFLIEFQGPQSFFQSGALHFLFWQGAGGGRGPHQIVLVLGLGVAGLAALPGQQTVSKRSWLRRAWEPYTKLYKGSEIVSRTSDLIHNKPRRKNKQRSRRALRSRPKDRHDTKRNSLPPRTVDPDEVFKGRSPPNV